MNNLEYYHSILWPMRLDPIRYCHCRAVHWSQTKKWFSSVKLCISYYSTKNKSIFIQNCMNWINTIITFKSIHRIILANNFHITRISNYFKLTIINDENTHDSHMMNKTCYYLLLSVCWRYIWANQIDSKIGNCI